MRILMRVLCLSLLAFVFWGGGAKSAMAGYIQYSSPNQCYNTDTHVITAGTCPSSSGGGGSTQSLVTTTDTPAWESGSCSISAAGCGETVDTSQTDTQYCVDQTNSSGIVTTVCNSNYSTLMDDCDNSSVTCDNYVDNKLQTVTEKKTEYCVQQTSASGTANACYATPELRATALQSCKAQAPTGTTCAAQNTTTTTTATTTTATTRHDDVSDPAHPKTTYTTTTNTVNATTKAVSTNNADGSVTTTTTKPDGTVTTATTPASGATSNDIAAFGGKFTIRNLGFGGSYSRTTISSGVAGLGTQRIIQNGGISVGYSQDFGNWGLSVSLPIHQTDNNAAYSAYDSRSIGLAVTPVYHLFAEKVHGFDADIGAVVGSQYVDYLHKSSLTSSNIGYSSFENGQSAQTGGFFKLAEHVAARTVISVGGLVMENRNFTDQGNLGRDTQINALDLGILQYLGAGLRLTGDLKTIVAHQYHYGTSTSYEQASVGLKGRLSPRLDAELNVGQTFGNSSFSTTSFAANVAWKLN